MFYNKELKQLTIYQIIIFVLALFFSTVVSTVIYNQYKVSLIRNNSQLIGTIVKNHPELETELIDALFGKEDQVEKGKEILEKYGLNSIDNLDYLANMSHLKNNLILYQAIFIAIVFFVLSVNYIFFVRKQYRKIHHVSQYMTNVLNNDYSFDIRDYNEGDISNLKNDIYRITTRLKEQSELANQDKLYLENVLSDISHQIRTPLTSMYVMNDLLMNEELDPKLRKDFLQKNHAQLERIEWLVTSLLKISQLDSGTIVLKEEEVNIQKLLDQALNTLSIPMELKNQKVEINGDQAITFLGDFHWTTECIVNILKNAHEHTKENGTIEIKYGQNPIYTYIEIVDNGEGIDEADLKHIFERFYKGKSSKKESIGIGLNMAKKIIEKEHGSIMVESKKTSGTKFILKFYKNVV